MNIEQLTELTNLLEHELVTCQRKLKRKSNNFGYQIANEQILFILELNNVIETYQGVELINELDYYLYYKSKECNNLLDEKYDGTSAYVAAEHRLYFINEINDIIR